MFQYHAFILRFLLKLLEINDELSVPFPDLWMHRYFSLLKHPAQGVLHELSVALSAEIHLVLRKFKAFQCF